MLVSSDINVEVSLFAVEMPYTGPERKNCTQKRHNTRTSAFEAK